MNDFRRLFGRRELVTTATAAMVPLGAVAFCQPSAPGRAVAQPALQATPPMSLTPPGPTMVYVNGYGSVRVAPDLASVMIGIDVQRPNLAEAQAEAATQATAIIDAIEAAGVDSADIRTANFSVRSLRERKRGEDDEQRGAEGGQRGEMSGFQVSYAVEVTIRDLDTLGRILDDAIAAGANEVRRIAFSLTDPTAPAAQARTRAVEDARAKADELATAAGMTVSRVVSISETFSPLPTPVEFVSANGGTAIADASRAEIPIAAGTDEVIVEVQAAYELM